MQEGIMEAWMREAEGYYAAVMQVSVAYLLLVCG